VHYAVVVVNTAELGIYGDVIDGWGSIPGMGKRFFSSLESTDWL
jgi:hypothetical protein